MFLSAVLPPSSRDFEIYFSVRVELKSLRATAAEVGVSQTRVRQIVERVGDFLLLAVPEGGDAQRAQRVELAKILAAERIEALHADMQERWRQSKGVQMILREVTVTGQPPVQTVLQKPSQGETKYAFAAAKLALLAAKSPAASLMSLLPQTENPPKEDCTPAPAKSPACEPAPAANVAASLPAEFTSVLDACRESRAENRFAGPAQSEAKSKAGKRRAFLANAG